MRPVNNILKMSKLLLGRIGACLQRIDCPELEVRRSVGGKGSSPTAIVNAAARIGCTR